MTSWFRKYSFLIIILLGLLQSELNINAQIPDIRVTLNANNKSIRSFLDEISLQTGLFFTFDASLFNEKSKKSLDLHNCPLNIAMDSIFSQKNLSYSLIDKNIVIHQNIENNPEQNINDQVISITVRGIIRDKSTKRRLSFVTIVLNGSNKGVLSNEFGEFNFPIPANIQTPILVFSMIGYKNQHLVIDPKDSKDFFIDMSPRYISLQEVIIRYNDPNKILENSIDSFRKNYLNQPSGMEAYFREFSLKNKKVMTFSEAALSINKQAYDDPGNDKVTILKGRKISNVSQEDSIILKIKSGVHSSLMLDIIKNPPDFLSSDFRRRYDLHFSDLIYFKDRLCYLISFKQKEELKTALFQGQIYIDQENLAIVAADFEVNPDYIHKESSMFFIKKSKNIKTRPINANYHVEYRKTEGFYHINRVHGEVCFKFRKKRKWFSSLYKIVIELAITEVNLDEYTKIKRSDQLKPQSILSDELSPSDLDFWQDYNIILPEEKLREAILRMGLDWERFENDK